MLNFHTHKTAPNSIISISSSFDSVSNNGIYSAGLHPWFLDDSTYSTELDTLTMALSKENVVAVGECGLDKIHQTPWDLQTKSFIDQIHLANQFNKPLILHCVRAFEEVLHLLEDHRVKVPVIFHGFNKSIQWAQQILHKGYYLSFGKSIFSPQKAEVFRQVPSDRLFLETDTDMLPIEQVYEEAARIRSVSVDELDHVIEDNIKSVFGKSLLYV